MLEKKIKRKEKKIRWKKSCTPVREPIKFINIFQPSWNESKREKLKNRRNQIHIFFFFLKAFKNRFQDYSKCKKTSLALTEFYEEIFDMNDKMILYIDIIKWSKKKKNSRFCMASYHLRLHFILQPRGRKKSKKKKSKNGSIFALELSYQS